MAEDTAAFRPFCSKRCKSIDLGSWLDGRYRISRPVEEQDDPNGGVTHVEEKPDGDPGG